MHKRIKNNIQAGLWKWSAGKSISRFQRELLEIVKEASARKIIIFPPGLGWGEPIIQRPQHLAMALSNQGCLVFYMEPETTKQLNGFEQQTENLVLCHVPLKTFDVLLNPYVITMTWNYKYARQIPDALIIYDFVDHLQVFSGNQKRLALQHSNLLQSAEIVLVTAMPLLMEVQTCRPDAILLPNGVDYEHFNYSEDDHDNPPADLENLLLLNSPIIGYSGALAHWFDYELIENTARHRPDLTFLLIGPDYDHSLPRQMLNIPNIVWLGSKSYETIPSYLRYFDVAIIPFQVNELTHAVSPLKLFEYMAAGKPVITSPLDECMRIPGVLIAQDAQELSQRIDEALELKSQNDYLKIINEVAKENTWDVRARDFMATLDMPSISRVSQG